MYVRTGEYSLEWGEVMTAKTAALVLLSALAASNVSAQSVGSQHWVDDLSGFYRCVQKCGGGRFIHLAQTGWNRDVTNETGQSSTAWIRGRATFGRLGVRAPSILPTVSPSNSVAAPFGSLSSP